VSPEREAGLRALQERLGHHFADLALLDRALTHSSRAHEDGGDAGDNEPLEFLGDSLLGFIVADLLHRRDPDGKEGLKSRARAQLVSSRSLSRRAAELGVPEVLSLGRGEEKTGGRQKAALWADAYEALIAALYLDGGLELAQRFVAAEFARELEAVPDLAAADPKSALQELLQGRGEALPEYVVVAEEGPSHRRRFRVRCVVGGQPVADGEGTSKKQAQQDAARKALDQLRAATT
jgi:ribonuclease-3